MKYDFETYVDRHNTASVKWDAWKEFNKPENVIPFWIADMDFKTAPEIVEALTARAEHGIFGYGKTPEGYRDAVVNWYKTYFGWEPKKEWMLYTPGVVFALAIAIRTCTKPGDGILIQRPVYYPFTNMIRENDRKIINSPLVYQDGEYSIDLADFEAKIRDNNVKLFVLCSPHNPVGRVWTKEELTAVGDICMKYGVKVVADEIHNDFAYGDHKHHVFVSLKKEYEDFTITCTSPSKTFNLAGLQISHIWIPNDEIREGFRAQLSSTGYEEPSVFGAAGALAAYTKGRPWFEECKAVIRANADFTVEYLKEHCPAIHCPELQGTYLLWLDCSGLPFDTAERQKRIDEAGLWFDTGSMFGEEGDAFERINLACPRTTLEEALRRLCEAFNK